METRPLDSDTTNNSANLPSEEAIQKHFSEEALAFVPSEIDIFIITSKGLFQRLIFSTPQELREEENKQMEAFREFLKSKGLELPPGYSFIINPM